MSVYLGLGGGTEPRAGESLSAIDCFRCGVCCIRYRPPVTHKEIEDIARELGMPEKEFIARYIRDVPDIGFRL